MKEGGALILLGSDALNGIINQAAPPSRPIALPTPVGLAGKEG